ncbi:DUF6075 family protein [Neobacillus muris]|uniref:DUF6075 family protein n=1 Tax=Neobacillus muris TaxID=2941334 RepID=UPI00203CBF06|nr:DUF6075 family protein [Neobacillus muris]
MFLSPNHEGNFRKLLQWDGTNVSDLERKAMFFIFAGNEEILKRIEMFYDFEERVIQTEITDNIAYLSSGARSLVLLGFNLFNNFPCGTVMDLFRSLDEQNCELALNGIRIRLGLE